MEKLFVVTQKLAREQNLEMSGVSEWSGRTSTWERLSLVNHEEVIKLTNANVYVLSDSVLRVGKMREFWHSSGGRESRLQWFKSTNEWRGRRESDSQVFCHRNSMHAWWHIDKDLSLTSISSAPPPPPPHTHQHPHTTRMFGKCTPCGFLCEEVLFGWLVIPRARFRNEMERDRHFQAWRRMGHSKIEN